MKSFLTLVFGFVFCFSLIGQTFITGQVLDPDLDEGLIAANISFYKGDVFLAGTVSDLDGNYNIRLDPGSYDIVFSYIGYASKKEEGFIILAGKTSILNIKMEIGLNLEEIVVIDYKIPLIEQDHTCSCNLIARGYTKPTPKVKEDSTLLLNIKTYPNPTSDVLNIQLDQAVDYLSFRSINGKEITSYNNVNTNLIQIDLSDFAAGAYVVQAIKGNLIASEKIVVVRN